jgi:glycosyl transferase family 87
MPRIVTTLGRILRGLLIMFALLGTQHLLRVIFASPSLNDLYPIWLGSRELLVHHRNPYSRELNAEIQTAFYGAPLPPGDNEEKQCCFAYPVYVSFLLAPALGSSFQSVSRVVLWLLVLATAASVACWLAVIGRSVVSLWLAIPLVVVSPPVAEGLDLRQLALFVVALLSVTAVLARHNHFTLAGLVLGCATIKPQMSILPVAWMLLWSLNDWGKRKKLFIGFVAMLAVLLIAGEIVMRDWIPHFIAQMEYYRHVTGQGMLDVLYGRSAGLILALVSALGLLFVMWRRRTASDFMPMLAFLLAIEVFVMPGMKSLFNLVLVTPGIFVVLRKYPAVYRARSVEMLGPERVAGASTS